MFRIAILLVSFIAGFFIGGCNSPKKGPAEVRFQTKSGVLLMTITQSPGNIVTLDDLESVTLTTNRNGTSRVSVIHAP